MCAVARSRIETCSKLASALVTPMIIRSPAMIRAAFSTSTMCSESTGRAGSAATAVSRSSMRRARSAAGSEETPRTVKRAVPSSSTGAVAISAFTRRLLRERAGAVQRSAAASVAAQYQTLTRRGDSSHDRKAHASRRQFVHRANQLHDALGRARLRLRRLHDLPHRPAHVRLDAGLQLSPARSRPG